MFRTNPGFTHQTVDKKLFSPPRRGRIALSVNERIAEFLDFAIQAKFAYVGKLPHKFRIDSFSAISRASKKRTAEAIRFFILQTINTSSGQRFHPSRRSSS